VSLSLLTLHDFRIFDECRFEPDPEGTTVITGPNGTGKTTMLEAVAYLGTQRSFRGAQREAMVRTGRPQAVIRAALTRAGLPLLVEAEVAAQGRSRAQVNRQPVRTRRDLAEAVPVTVFSPEDLGIVQGTPSRRRDLLDDALRLLDPKASALLEEVERVLRQRGALLRQAGGRLGPEIAATLDVWDERLAQAGTDLATARTELARALQPLVAAAYAALARPGSHPGPTTAATRPRPSTEAAIEYRATWEGSLAGALARARADDVRRGASTVGPHRDDLVLALGGRDARVQASQGEQRCLALALRLGVHHLVTERLGVPPILLLDDVFSELDPVRSHALVTEIPRGQALLTTAVPLPAGVEVAAVVDVRDLTGPAP